MSDTNQAIITRLQKLLALANSNANEHEAEVAMSKAQALMAEHNLSLAQIEQDTGATAKREKTEISSKALYEYQRQLMATVAHVNMCLCWVQYTKVRNSAGVYRKVPSYVIVGREANVTTARHMFDYLNATMERLVPIASNKDRLSKSAISWKEGCAARLRGRLYARKRELEAEDRARKAAQPQGTGGGSALVVRLDNLFEMEDDANYEFMYGMQPGEMARRRAERAAKTQEAPQAEPVQETPAEKARREEANRKYWEREDRREKAKWARKDLTAYMAGHKAAEDIGLDTQVEADPQVARRRIA